MRALVTGGRGGIGTAIVAALRGEGAEVTVLDLPEFDVGDAPAWRALDGPYDAAFLNAGIGIGQPDAGLVTDEEYRRILARERGRRRPRHARARGAADAGRRLDRRDRLARRPRRRPRSTRSTG